MKIISGSNNINRIRVIKREEKNEKEIFNSATAKKQNDKRNIN
jgi:hypothetical protein